jgi:hypothetical protein
MKQNKHYLITESDKSFKVKNYKDFPISSEEFKEILSLQKDSGFDYETFPEGEDFHDLQNTSNSLNINYVEGKYDRAFYYSLRKIQWDLFLSIQFRKPKYKARSDSAFQNRRAFMWEFFEETKARLFLSKQDLHYFCFEENNRVEGSHFHIVVFCKRPDKASVDKTRQAMLDILKEYEHIVIIPPNHTKHVQKIDYRDRVLKYSLKINLDDTEKPYFHSVGFCCFYNRHLKWLEKQTSDSWITLGSTTSSVSFFNTKNPIVGY